MDDFVVLEPVYNPQAVADYCLYGTQAGRRKDPDLILKTKKHLIAVGWTFFYKQKAADRRELRYRSPTGKTYISLVTACQSLINDQRLINGQDGDHDVVLMKGQDGDDGLKKMRVREKGFEGFRAKKRNLVQNVEPFCSHGKKEVIPKPKKRLVEKEVEPKPKKRLVEKEIEPKPKKRLIEKEVEPKPKKRVGKLKKRVRETAGGSTQPRCVLSLLVQRGIVLPGARVVYRNRKDSSSMAQGRIYSDGIQCDCCQQKFLLSKFEAHAGSTYHRPSANIFLDDGRSLFDCQAQLNQASTIKGFKVVEPTKASEPAGNDEMCSVCWDCGDLVLCDSCPFSFHPTCIGLDAFPSSENWFCPSCCCWICGQGNSKSTEDSLDHCQVKCAQCEHQFHKNCLRKDGTSTDIRINKLFCSEECQRIFAGLQRISGKSISLGANNLSWSLLKLDPYGIDRDAFTETCSKLTVALEVIHDCFEPVIHVWTNSDLLEDVIYSRTSVVKRSNFRGFFTVVLEREEEVIAVAAVRVHGVKVAEIPLVATRREYRRQGMCHVLMDKLEQELVELGVERLVLPAIPEVVNTWTQSFGFSVMTEPERLSLLTCSFLDFPGTIKCHKMLKLS